jgi:hypothetical protein
LPWTVEIGRELNDDLIRIVREWIMHQFGFEPKREDVSDVLFALARQASPASGGCAGSDAVLVAGIVGVRA